MNCRKCDGAMNRKVVTYVFNSKLVGQVLVPNIEMLVCASCKYKVLTISAAQGVSAFVKAKEVAAIGDLPVKLMLSLDEAADHFQVSKQAISKHPKIKAGFVITCKKGRSNLYYRPSLEAFYATGDGRIPISSAVQEAVVVSYLGGRHKVNSWPALPVIAISEPADYFLNIQGIAPSNDSVSRDTAARAKVLVESGLSVSVH